MINTASFFLLFFNKNDLQKDFCSVVFQTFEWHQLDRLGLAFQVLVNDGFAALVLLPVSARVDVHIHDSFFRDFDLSAGLHAAHFGQFDVLAACLFVESHTDGHDSFSHDPQVHNAHFQVVDTLRTRELVEMCDFLQNAAGGFG